MPIDVASGALYTAGEDCEVDGYFNLVWRRYYSTAFLQRRGSAQGAGWVHGYDITLAVDGDRYLFRGRDGLELEFDKSDDRIDTQGVLLAAAKHELRREFGEFRVYTWNDWESEVHCIVFERAGALAWRARRIEHPSGHGISLSYDEHGRLVRVVQDVERRALLLEYGHEDRISALSLADARGERVLVCSYRYDLDGRLVEAVDAAGAVHAYRYDLSGRMVLERPRAGGAYYFTYDSRGRCVQLTGDGRQGFRRVSYNDAARISTVTDSLGNRRIYELNESGQAVIEALPNGATKRREFDELGRVVVEQFSMGHRRTFRFDERGNLVETTFPNGGYVRVAFNDVHQPVTLEESDGGVWQFEYQRGAITAVVDPLGNRKVYVRDEQNVLAEIHTTAGNRILVRADSDWTAETYSDAIGLILRTEFTLRLAPAATYDARGLIRRFVYTASGVLSQVIEVDGSVEEFDSDDAGQLVRYTSPDGAVTRLEYDQYNNFVSVTNANNGRYRYTTDTEGRITSIVAPDGNTASLRYNESGWPTYIELFDGRRESYVYDLLGRCISREKTDGTRIDYEYGNSYMIASVSSGGTVLVRNRYDDCEQLVETRTPTSLVQRRFDLCGHLVQEARDGRVVNFGVGPHGYVETCSRGEGGIDGIRFDYDQRGRLRSFGTLTVPVQTFDYDAADLITTRRCGDVTESFLYDARGRMTMQTVSRSSGGEIVTRRFEYDGSSNVVAESDSLRGHVAYQFGPTGLLLSSTHSERGSVSYSYDSVGNILRRNDESFHYEGNNRLVARGAIKYRRDENGNRVAAEGDSVTLYEWDVLDQLVAVIHPDGRRTTYEYDGVGRRTRTDDDGREIIYDWAGDRLLGVDSSAGKRDFAFGEFEPNAFWDNGTVRHVFLSHRGLPYEVIDESGWVLWRGEYDDWGRLLEVPPIADADPRLGLPGQQYDPESGLHYTRFRYYDAAETRFISPDPMGIVAGFNGFLYGPNAINWIDPLGLHCGRKAHSNSVYVLKRNGKIVYVGITKRDPAVRMREHARGNPSKGVKAKNFDEMVVVATGLTRRQARNIEGSALKNIAEAQAGTGPPIQNVAPSLDNAPRQGSNTYCHSYDSNTSGPGRQVFSPAQTNQQLNNPNGQSIPNP